MDSGLRRNDEETCKRQPTARASTNFQPPDQAGNMATSTEFVDYVAEQIALGDRLTRKKMFGEYALYVDGKVVAFACDNSLFVKPSAAVARLAPGLPQRPPVSPRVAIAAPPGTRFLDSLCSSSRRRPGSMCCCRRLGDSGRCRAAITQLVIPAKAGIQ
jgi:hypothetical protein